MKQAVLVTGGARRVGAALARAVAAHGHLAIVHYQRSEDAARRLAEEITAGGGRSGIIQADFTDRDATASLIARCTDRFGSVGVLVNNASGYRYDTIDTLEAGAWDENLRTNLEAPLFLAKAFAGLCGEGGSIINMLDFKVTNLNPDYFSYTVAKVAMAGATRMLAMAFRGRVRVNGIAPGLTLQSGRQTEEQFARAWRMTPLGHGPLPEELGRAATYLIDTPSVNGQILSLDGGASLRPRPRDISVDPLALGKGVVSHRPER
jgi:NAD(P)-dependent dehydrogenase (short-subunit alcohol dehydrogenase family)